MKASAVKFHIKRDTTMPVAFITTSTTGTTNLRSGAAITGDVFSNGALALGVGTVVTGNVKAVGPIVLSAGARVVGSATSGGTINLGTGAAVTGHVDAQAGLMPTTAQTVDAFAAARGLAPPPTPGGVFTAPPALAGAYTFDSLNIAVGASVSIQQSLQIRIRGSATVGAGATITVAPGRILQILVDGDLTISAGAALKNDSTVSDSLLVIVRGQVSVGTGAKFIGGAIYAPGSPIVIPGGTGAQFRGAAVGASITLGVGAAAQLEPARLCPGGRCFSFADASLVVDEITVGATGPHFATREEAAQFVADTVTTRGLGTATVVRDA